MNTFSLASEEFELLIYCAVFAAIISIAYFLYSLYRNCTQKLPPERSNLPPSFAMCWSFILLFADLVSSFPLQRDAKMREKDDMLLKKSGFNMRLNELYGAQWFFFLSAAVSCFWGYMFLSLFPVFGGAGAVLKCILLVLPVLFYFLPKEIVKEEGERRRSLILSQLPFAIDIITSSMTAGLTFHGAVRYFVNSCDKMEELRMEFRQMLQDMDNRGSNLVSALKLMKKRLEISEVSRFIDALIFGHESGAPIIRILKVQADEMRRIKYEIAEKKAETAKTRMVLPLALIFISIVILIVAKAILFFSNSGFTEIFSN